MYFIYSQQQDILAGPMSFADCYSILDDYPPDSFVEEGDEEEFFEPDRDFM